MLGPKFGPPGPSAKPNGKQTTKVVVALYSFKAQNSKGLSLQKGAEYQVIDDSQQHWWLAKDKNGHVGYIPSIYVKNKETIGLRGYEWYVGNISRERVESVFMQENKEGCFVVRKSTSKGMYTLSVYTKVNRPQTVHYHINLNSRGEFYLWKEHCFASIPDLINYYKHNKGNLCSRLTTTLNNRPAPPTAGLSYDKWEINPSELVLMEVLGAGSFGTVRHGKWRGSKDVAVKMMNRGAMSEDEFIREAKVMTKLHHQHVVQLYGVCTKRRPIFIVTEYMRHGSLLKYLTSHNPAAQRRPDVLLDICIQVCKGMAYLERQHYVHRDLAARNCLVGDEFVVKVADFGLTRYVVDDQYISSGNKFPLRWVPPEVLTNRRFSTKSDVWAFGVLMWEVFTGGMIPHGQMDNNAVANGVLNGMVLGKPNSCPNKIYNVMHMCWRRLPEERPSFQALTEALR